MLGLFLNKSRTASWTLPLALAWNTVQGAEFSLPELINLTLANHPVMTQTQAQIQEAKAMQAQALSYALPKVTAKATAVRTDDALQSFGMKVMERQASFADFGAGDFNPMAGANGLAVKPHALNYPGDHSDYGTSLQVEVPLWTGGQLSSARNMATHGYQAALAQKEWKSQELRMELLSAYARYQGASAYVKVAQRAESTYVELKRMLEAMALEGLIPKSDIMAAQIKVDESVLLGRKAMDQVADAQTHILLMAGQDPRSNTLRLGDTLGQSPIRSCEDALQSNPGLRAAKSMTQVSEQQIRMAQSGWMPMVGTMAKVEAHNPDHPHYEAWSYTLGLSAEWALFEGGRTQANIDKARANHKQWNATVARVQQSIQRQCMDTHRQIATAEFQMQSRQKALEQALEMRRLVQGRLQAGLAPLIEWFGAQTQVEKAEAEVVSAQQELWMQKSAAQMIAGNLP